MIRDPFAFAAKLGWSNPDTGPAPLRLYALDAGRSPRWDRPRARVAEDPLIAAGGHDRDRVVVVAVGLVDDGVLAACVAAAQAAVTAVVDGMQVPLHPPTDQASETGSNLH